MKTAAELMASLLERQVRLIAGEKTGRLVREIEVEISQLRLLAALETAR